MNCNGGVKKYSPPLTEMKVVKEISCSRPFLSRSLRRNFLSSSSTAPLISWPMMASWPFRSCGNPWLYTHPGHIVKNSLSRSIGKGLLTIHHKLEAVLNGTLITGKQETTLDVVILPGLPHRSIRDTATHHQILGVIADPNARVGFADVGREWAIGLLVGIFVVPVVQVAVKAGAFKWIFLHRSTCGVVLIRVQMNR